MSVSFDFAARSNIGLGRYKNNQDSGFAGQNLLAVCDGMGGHAGGDVASSIAIAHLAALDSDSVGPEAPQLLVKSIKDAHSAMLARVDAESQLSGMGTTVTALLRYGDKLALAHVGDSRAYVIRDGVLTQITKDHTFVQWLIDQGQITEEEAESHPQRSVIMRVLGDVEADDQIDTSARTAVVGERWMLCSDGLSGCVSQGTIQQSLASIADPGECADHLIDLALKGGGQDNITCVIADVVAATDSKTRAPVVVGAAGESKKEKSQKSTPASRAAALTATEPLEEVATPINASSDAKTKKWRPWIVGSALLAVTSICLFSAYAWTQTQYFVGPNGKNVGIFQGVSQNVGAVSLSELKETTIIPLDTLSENDRRTVEDYISTGDYDEAKAVTLRLLKASKLCKEVQIEPVNVPTTVVTTPPDSPTPTPLEGSTPLPQGPETTITPSVTSTQAPVVASTATPAPTLEPKNFLGQPLPDECNT